MAKYVRTSIVRYRNYHEDSVFWPAAAGSPVTTPFCLKFPASNFFDNADYYFFERQKAIFRNKASLDLFVFIVMQSIDPHVELRELYPDEC